MRFPASVRPIATLLMAIGVATCSDTPIAAVKANTAPGARLNFGHLAMSPVFSKTAQFVAQRLADFPTLQYDSVRVLIRGNPDTTVIVKDTTVFFDKNSRELTLDLTVPVATDGQRFNAAMDYRGPVGTVFRGVAIIQSHRADQPAPAQQQITINYVGPGAKLKSINVTPKSTTLLGTQSTTLAVTATDSSGAPITVPPLAWTSSNPAIASVVNNGSTATVQGQNRRGASNIGITTPLPGIGDGASVSVTLPAASIGVVSGGGQSGKVGASLANPAVVQVSASDGVGVAGVSVVFSAPAGGSVSPTVATTDANGRASTSMKLGSAVGPQGFAATAAGFSTAIGATATAGDPAAIAVVSGGMQADTIKKTLAPLVVRVTDAFGNPTAGVTVSWTKTAGGGTLGSATTTTNADGVSSNSYTLGGTPGAEGASASAGGQSAAFSFTALPGGAAAIAAVSGSGQTGRVDQPLANPFVVRVTDVAGNPVSGAAVSWSAANGTLTASGATDASGQASATLKAGLALGAASATARIANGQSVSFSATIQAGFVSKLAYAAQPTSGTAGVALAPVKIALQDAGGNQTAAINPVTIALGANPAGGTLKGTLTRSAVNGVATFDDLVLDKVGSGYTLVASSGSLTPAPSSEFSIAAGGAAGMAVSAGNGQAATVNTNVATAPAVRITDGSGNPIVGASVTFTPGSGSGTVSPVSGTVVTNALGIATLSSWTLGTTAGTQSLVVTSTGLQPVTFTATASAGNAYKLVLQNKASLQASTATGAPLTPQPIIQVTDQYGNPVPAGVMSVSAGVTATSGVTLGGTASMSLGATSGQATFTNLSISGTGSTRLVFKESSGLIRPDTSATIAISAAVPTQLQLVPASPTSFTLTAGQAFTLPQVKVVDAQGNGVAGVTVRAVLDSGTSPNTAVLGAGDFVTDGSGIATLTTPSDTTAGTFRVTATLPSTPGIAPAVITATVVPAAASEIRIFGISTNQNVVAGVALPFKVAITDRYGNVVTSASPTSVSIALNSPSGVTGAALNDVTPVSTTNGVAQFTNRSIAKAAIGFSITATAGTYTVTSPAFNVSAAAASKLSFQSVPTSAVTSQNVNVTVQLLDDFNNMTPTTGTTVALTGSPTTFTGGGNATSNNGNATYTLNFSAAGNYTLTATASGLTSVTSSTFTVSTGTAGIPAKLAFITQPPASVITNATVSPSVRVQVQDASGNPVTTATNSVYLTISSGGSITGGATVNASGGIATFPSLKVTSTGTYTLTASSNDGLTAATSSSVVSAPGTPSQLAFESSVFHAALGGSTSARVLIKDDYGNTVTTASGHVTLTLTGGTSGAALSNGGTGAVSEALVSGRATFSNLSVSLLGNGYSLIASTDVLNASGGPIANTSSATFSVVNVTLPTNLDQSSGAASGFTVVTPKVTATDVSGARIANVPVRFTPTSPTDAKVGLSTSSGLGGSIALSTDANGEALVYWKLSATAGANQLSVVAGGKTLTATAYGTSTATTLGLTAGAGQSAVAGAAVSIAPKVRVTDAQGNGVASFPVTFAVATGGGTVASSLGNDYSSVNVSTDEKGYATLASWILGTTAGSNTLTVSGSGLTSLTVTATATVGAVDHLAFVTGHDVPETISNDVALSGGPQILAVDANGNPVPNVTIDASVEAPASNNQGPGPSAFTDFSMFSLPTLSVVTSVNTNASGIADFSGAKLRGLVQSLKLRFTARGMGISISRSSALKHGVANKATCLATFPGRVSLSHRLTTSPRFRVLDIDDNIVDSTAIELVPSTGGSVAQTLVTTDSLGEVSGSNWTVGGTAGAHSVSVRNATGSCQVNASAIHHLLPSVTSMARLKNGDIVPDLDVTVVDVDGNAIEDSTFTVKAEAHTHSDRVISISSSKSSNGRGKSTFQNLVVDAQSQTGATLDFSLDGAPTIKGSVTFDVDAGDASDLDNSEGNSVSGSPASILTDAFTATIKDRNKRNGVGSAGVVVTWTLGTGCSAVSFALASQVTAATSTTAANGRATSPALYLAAGFGGTCTITASATGLTSTTFTIH